VIADNHAVSVIDGSPPTIRLRGHIDSSTSSAIGDAFRRLSAHPHGCIRVDAGGVRHIEQACVQALAEGVRTVEASGAAVKLVRASRELRTALRNVGLIGGYQGAYGMPYRSGLGWESRLDLPCEPRSVAVIRAQAAAMAARLPFTPTELDDVVLAVGEAAANAVRHGLRAGARGVIHVRCRADRTGFCVEITDPGDGFDPERVQRPKAGVWQEGGLGIYLMRRIMDAVSYTFDARGTTVRLIKRASSAAPAQ
jgi:serine/threonine-protein kinase RsbW